MNSRRDPSSAPSRAPGDQQHGVRDGVAGDDELEPGPARVQVGADAGDRDVDDRRVEQGHELRHDQDGEHGPIAAVRDDGELVLGGLGRLSGHRASLPRRTDYYREPSDPGTSTTWHQDPETGQTGTRDHCSPGCSSPDGTPAAIAGHRRRELAEFLRTRRARLTPEDIGLAPGVRRRTPGLRREEVAQEAGVGVTWYTWLEQGRPIKASSQVLDSVARALRLDEAEREHLYQLSDLPLRVTRADVPVVSEALREVVDSLDPLPGGAVEQSLGPARDQRRLPRHLRVLARRAVPDAQHPVVHVHRARGPCALSELRGRGPADRGAVPCGLRQPSR